MTEIWIQNIRRCWDTLPPQDWQGQKPCQNLDARTAEMLGWEGSQTVTKPWTLSWLVFVLLSKATPAQPCQEQGLGCSSQRRAPLAPPPGKGCCAANKEVSNAFWVSSSITHSPLPPPGAGTHTLRNASLPCCYQAWQRRCTGRLFPEKEFPVWNFCLVLSSDMDRHCVLHSSQYLPGCIKSAVLP